MDSEELEKQKSYEWNRLIKKIAKDCRKCEGLTFIPVPGERYANPCPICIPKAKTITFLKESGMNVDDIKSSPIPPANLISEKCLFLQGEQKSRQALAFGILKEEAKQQRTVFFIELSNLLPELKKGNKDYLRYDTLFIDSIDIYRSVDQYTLPFYDGILFTYKNNPKKKLIVAGHTNCDGYATRFMEIYGTNFKLHFV